ncbi:MAG: FeoA family protein [Candidatus Omnitrophica bacterium]|nr:FeoA family protein [Candidatus Omnitrophota bacterium]
MIIDLTRVRQGESGIIEEIQGGLVALHKIQSIGLRPGKKIKKVSSHFLCGPQTVKVGHMQVAIGFGMAKKILIKVERRSEHK